MVRVSVGRDDEWMDGSNEVECGFWGCDDEMKHDKIRTIP